MDMPNEKGVSKRKYELQRAKQFNADAVMMDEDIPVEYVFYYRLFWDLWSDKARVDYQTIYYYQLIRKIELTDNEIDLMFYLSAKCHNFIESKKVKKNGRHNATRGSDKGRGR